MRIGFYLDNSRIQDIDLSRPFEGNPGIGGTEYMFLLISYYLSKEEEFEVHLYVSCLNSLPQNLIIHRVLNYDDLFRQCENDAVDYLICRSFGSADVYKKLNNTNLKVLLWAHNFAKLKELNIISKCKNVVKYVCVSSRQLDLLYGHSVYKKSSYIFNSIVSDVYRCCDVKRKSVCYVGSIIPNKGFDVCAKIWRRLYDKYGDIELDVIGSGRLYNTKTELGRYGVAKKEYEEVFMPYLLHNNKLIPQVHFHGVLNHEEKIKVMASSYIGMPNPTGNTETFGISFVEFEALGTPVVAKGVCGIKDTVNEYICDDEEGIFNSCVEILDLPKEEYSSMSLRARDFSLKFDINIIIKDWIYLLNNIDDIEFHKNSRHTIMDSFINIVNLCRNVQV